MTSAWQYRLSTQGGHPASVRSPLPHLSPYLRAKCKGESGRGNAFIFLYLWIGDGVANHVVSAGPQSGFRLVLLALQTSRDLFGAACSRDLLCVRAADSEWSSLRFRRAHGCASLAAFRVEGNGYESGEREVRYRDD